MIHSGSFIGGKVPVWDIRKKFGDTDLLVRNMAQGRDLAKCMGNGSVALMRGHGFASAARSIIEVVRLSVYLPRNARVQMNAMRMGGKPKPLSKGEIAARAKATSRTRRKPGGPGNTGQPAPAVATKSASRMISRTRGNNGGQSLACH